MAIRSGFFNSVNGDRKYDASRFAEYFATFISNGVFPNPSTNLQVMANNDMTVTVKVGKAWINGYILINDDDYILEIEPADGVLNRIDRIVARYDVVDREIRLEVKKGTFANNPAAPELQRDADAYELALADIYVAKGAVSITQANITDLRFNTELCGIVKGTVDQIDTTDLFAQYQTAFNDWFQELKDVLDDNTAANLLNLINQLDDDLASHQADYAQHTQDESAHGIGNKTLLKTNEKSTIVGAVNELFTNVSNGKSLVGRAITDVDPNVTIPAEPTFQQLADAIGQITGGSMVLIGAYRDIQSCPGTAPNDASITINMPTEGIVSAFAIGLWSRSDAYSRASCDLYIDGVLVASGSNAHGIRSVSSGSVVVKASYTDYVWEEYRHFVILTAKAWALE